MKSVVIIGGGFAGVNAARKIAASMPSDCILTLISRGSRFTFKPLLHEVATGSFSDSIACEDLHFPKRKNFRLVEGAASSISLSKQVVKVGKAAIRYDYLLVAVGSVPDFFGIPGAERHSFGINSFRDAFLLRDALIDASRKKSPSVVVVGGGPLGVEISAEVAQYCSQLCRGKKAGVVVINGAQVLLPQVNEKFRNLVLKFLSRINVSVISGRKAVKVGQNFVVTDDGRKIGAGLVVWAAGVKPAPIPVIPKVRLQNGFFPVNSYLQLEGCKNVFAAGDCALIRNPDGSQVPLLAQSAVYEGKFVAKNIIAALTGKPMQKFVFRQGGFLVPVGKGRAVAEIKGFVFSGFFAWWLNRTIYLFHMLGFRHKVYVALQWTLGLFTKRAVKKTH